MELDDDDDDARLKFYDVRLSTAYPRLSKNVIKNNLILNVLKGMHFYTFLQICIRQKLAGSGSRRRLRPQQLQYKRLFSGDDSQR
jgi:hypothetical protein